MIPVQQILELRKVSKQYQGHRVVNEVTLSVERGKLFCLLGPSGCGKTTTLRMIAGFERPDSGEILLDGKSILHLPPYRRNVSTVFQSYALFPHLTVQGNVEFGLRRKAAENVQRRVREVLELVHMSGKEARLPAQLSGGEKQRVALARSLVVAPDVLLLDEPLSALDPILRKQVRTELHDLQRRVGITFLLVTHDQEEALELADLIAVMNNGGVEQCGTPREIYLAPRTRFVAGFLGAMNWIDGVGIRPEATRIGRSAPVNGERSRPATVRISRFLGNVVHVESLLEPEGHRVLSETAPSDGHFEPGERIHVWWRPADELHLPQ
jgi:ABC-type Fe3+/spermidine/putrescine transport system ATPase subunit